MPFIFSVNISSLFALYSGTLTSMYFPRLHFNFKKLYFYYPRDFNISCSVSKLCLTLGKPRDCSPPGSSVHGILQARILEWVAISYFPTQRSNCQHPLYHRKTKGIPRKIYFFFIDYAKFFDCVDHNKLWKILKEMGLPDHLTYLLRNLYVGQEATVD